VVVKVGDLGAEADVKTAYEGMYQMGRIFKGGKADGRVGIDTVVSCVGRGAIESQINL